MAFLDKEHGETCNKVVGGDIKLPGNK